MRVITVGRKPPHGGTTHNVVEYEAGAININACRLSYLDSSDLKLTKAKNPGKNGELVTSHVYGANRPQQTVNETGRWPANVILVHLLGCHMTGIHTVPGHVYETEQLPDEDIPSWECEEGCPYTFLGRLEARYFKQVQETKMNEIPPDLWEYLYLLIAPPTSCNPVVIVAEDLKGVDFSQYEDGTVHGMIAVGDPGEYMKEIDRVLRPGAHLLLIAPEEDLTGHLGACSVEDFGYEIRDAIALLDRDDDFYYVAKPSSEERHAGVPEHKDEHTGRVVRNAHETVKPVSIMQSLLQNIPTDQGPVVDPFLGSGTTGIACLHTKHNFIGIEQNAGYLKIADQRIRYWDRITNAWENVTIKSEVGIENEEEGPVALEDLFGF